jgi:hypothetical protein
LAVAHCGGAALATPPCRFERLNRRPPALPGILTLRVASGGQSERPTRVGVDGSLVAEGRAPCAGHEGHGETSAEEAEGGAGEEGSAGAGGVVGSAVLLGPAEEIGPKELRMGGAGAPSRAADRRAVVVHHAHVG